MLRLILLLLLLRQFLLRTISILIAFIETAPRGVFGIIPPTLQILLRWQDWCARHLINITTDSEIMLMYPRRRSCGCIMKERDFDFTDVPHCRIIKLGFSIFVEKVWIFRLLIIHSDANKLFSSSATFLLLFAVSLSSSSSSCHCRSSPVF